MRPGYIKTTDIDLSSAIMTLAEIRPVLFPGRSPGDPVEIVFSASDEIRLIAQRYATGELLAPVKRLATLRNTLICYAKEVDRTRREVAL